MYKDKIESTIETISTGDNRKKYVRFIVGRTGFSFAEAETVLQDALLDFWAARHRVVQDDPKPFFDCILRRKCVRARNSTRMSRATSYQDGSVILEHRDPDPVDGLMVDQMLADLSEKQQAVIIEWASNSRGGHPDARHSCRIRTKLKKKYNDPEQE